jgi:hypothetical protein
MDRHELMEFLKGANINVTQNNIQAPYDGNIAAYVEGRWNDIEAHSMSTKGAGVEEVSPQVSSFSIKWPL